MDEKTMSLFRDQYTSAEDYRKAYREACQHYDFKVRVEGGWKFFEHETDYSTWKNQK